MAGAKQPIICFETGERFESMSAAARHLGVVSSQVIGAVRMGYAVRGLHFYPEGEHRSASDFRRTKETPVVCFETGRVFGSITEAGEWVGATMSQVSGAIRGRYSIGGYHFHRPDDVVTPDSFTTKRGRPVVCVETGERFASISAAAMALGISPSYLSASVRSCSAAKGLHFYREGDEWTGEGRARKRRSRTPVVCVDTGERFPSVTEAARHLGICGSSIFRAITSGGTAGGLTFRREDATDESEPEDRRISDLESLVLDLYRRLARAESRIARIRGACDEEAYAAPQIAQRMRALGIDSDGDLGRD